MTFITNFVALFVESAPYLLLGMLIAGIIHHWVPRSAVEKVLGQKGSVVSAAFIGAPLPLCSCSVIPVAMGVRRSGASKASTASFLVSTPETGVDSIGITYALMGPIMAVVRPVAAIVSAIITGFVIAIWGREEAPIQTEPAPKKCCHGHTSAPSKPSWRDKVIGVFTYGFDKLLADFMRWLLIGLFFAALIVTFVPANWMASYGSGPLAMLLMVAISIPMYICATASTPIAVGLLMAGISPGAALVFMLTGPATNIATLMVIKNELGKRELYLYLVALIGSALAAGLLVDYLFVTFNWSLALSHGEHSDMQSVLYNASAMLLAGLMIRQLALSWRSNRSAVSA